jgi:GNAT superfamily N-acetyltransferase
MNHEPGRVFQGRTDLFEMSDLTRQNRAALHLNDYPSSDDLEEMMTDPQVLANTRIWDDSTGQMIAFALVDAFYNLCWEIRREQASSELESEIAAWAEQCSRRMAKLNREKARVEASCREEDSERVSFLTANGFQLQTEKTHTLILDLNEPLAAPKLPAGFSIRPVNGEAEAEELAAIHCKAFSSKFMTRDRRLAAMRSTEYRPELDLVVVSPDGRLAGTCTGVIHDGENELTGVKTGSTDPLAVLPEFRKKGLAKALLLACAAALKQDGMQYARCAFNGANRAMLAAAKSAGYKVESTMVWFKKPLV